MPRRNFFISYKHKPDYKYLMKLRDVLKHNFSDYGFKNQDLEEESKWEISRKIQYRLWGSSVVIVLVGEETARSNWIDWEIWYSLRLIQKAKIARRIFKPKGLIALYLPVERHSVPKRLQKNLDSGYASEIYWKELEKSFNLKVNEAYENRKKYHLIKNSSKPKINPQSIFNRILDFILPATKRL